MLRMSWFLRPWSVTCWRCLKKKWCLWRLLATASAAVSGAAAVAEWARARLYLRFHDAFSSSFPFVAMSMSACRTFMSLHSHGFEKRFF